MANLPADLPEDWTQSQFISPNGTEVGLDTQHGYNYLMEQVNATQTEVNAINTSLEDVAQETSVQQVITTIGTTTDSGGSSTEGSLMAKLNEILEQLGISTTGSTVQEVLEELLNQPKVIKYSQKGQVSVKGSVPVALDGFTNIDKMMFFCSGSSSNNAGSFSVAILNLAVNGFTLQGIGTGTAQTSYQVFEFY